VDRLTTAQLVGHTVATTGLFFTVLAIDTVALTSAILGTVGGNIGSGGGAALPTVVWDIGVVVFEAFTLDLKFSLVWNNYERWATREPVPFEFKLFPGFWSSLRTLDDRKRDAAG
jgi:hypothetical protein